MNKRGVFGIIVLLVVINLVFIQILNVRADMPSSGQPNDADVGAIQNLTGQIPIDDSGNVDSGKLGMWESQAELRIDAINLWLKTNATWLTIVFGMVPEISWLFAFNFYILLLVFVNLVLNGLVIKIPVELMMIVSKGEENSDKILNVSRIIGLVIFIILLELKIFLHLAQFSITIWDFILTKVVPTGLVVAIIAGIIMVVVLIVLFIYAPEVLLALDKAYEAWKEKREKAKEGKNRKKLEEDVEVAEEFVKGVTGK